jgi:uncharacterized cupin superfamily protein
MEGSDATVRRLEDFESMSHGGMTMFRVRAGLDVRSFGMQVIRIPPHNESYPEHDHSEEGAGGKMFAQRPDQLGQEEVYIALEGSGTLVAEGEEWRLEPGVFARVGPSQARKIVTGDEELTILALGGTPEQAFQPAAL